MAAELRMRCARFCAGSCPLDLERCKEARHTRLLVFHITQVRLSSLTYFELRREEDKCHRDKNRAENQKRISQIAEESRHLDINHLGDCFHHTVRAIADVRQLPHEDGAATDRLQNLFFRVH